MMPRSRALVDGGMGLESGSGGLEIGALQVNDGLALAVHVHLTPTEVLAQTTEQQLRILDGNHVGRQLGIPLPGLAHLLDVVVGEALAERVGIEALGRLVGLPDLQDQHVLVFSILGLNGSRLQEDDGRNHLARTGRGGLGLLRFGLLGGSQLGQIAQTERQTRLVTHICIRILSYSLVRRMNGLPKVATKVELRPKTRDHHFRVV